MTSHLLCIHIVVAKHMHTSLEYTRKGVQIVSWQSLACQVEYHPIITADLISSHTKFSANTPDACGMIVLTHQMVNSSNDVVIL